MAFLLTFLWASGHQLSFRDFVKVPLRAGEALPHDDDRRAVGPLSHSWAFAGFGQNGQKEARTGDEGRRHVIAVLRRLEKSPLKEFPKTLKMPIKWAKKSPRRRDLRQFLRLCVRRFAEH